MFYFTVIFGKGKGILLSMKLQPCCLNHAQVTFIRMIVIKMSIKDFQGEKKKAGMDLKCHPVVLFLNQKQVKRRSCRDLLNLMYFHNHNGEIK